MEAGLDVEAQRPQRRTVGPGTGRDRHPHHDVVALAERDGEDGVQFFLLLDEPHHLLGLVAEVLGRLGELEKAAQAGRVDVVTGRP